MQQQAHQQQQQQQGRRYQTAMEASSPLANGRITTTGCECGVAPTIERDPRVRKQRQTISMTRIMMTITTMAMIPEAFSNLMNGGGFRREDDYFEDGEESTNFWQ
jgi:hypothetical protein